MDLFIKATKLFNELGKTAVVREIMNNALIRIEGNKNGHNYGSYGDVVRVEVIQGTEVVVSGKDTWAFNNLRVLNGGMGNSIRSDDFSIAVDSTDKIKRINYLVKNKIKNLENTLDVLAEIENYMERYGLDKINVDYFISNAITEILDKDLSVTERTISLVELFKKNIEL